MNTLAIRKFILLGVAFILLLSAAVLLYFTFFQVYEEKEEIEASLKKIDSFIIKGNLVEAESLLARVFSQAKTGQVFLQILKRFHTIAVIRNDFKILKDYAVKAYEKLSGNSKLAIIAIYAALRAGDLDYSLKISSKFETEKTVLPFFLETIMRGNLNIDLHKLEKAEALNYLLELESTSDPDRFIEAAASYAENRLFLDAALLYLKNGDYKNAYLIAEKYLPDSPFNELGGIIAYDAGEYPSALVRLKEVLRENPERSDIYIMVGDVSLALGLLEEANRYYKKVIQTDPKYSVIPYVNLAFILKTQNKVNEAVSILENAQSYFPNDKLLTLELVKLLNSLQEKEKASFLLNKYLEVNQEDFDANLLKVYLEWGDIPPLQYKIKLRELFNSNLRNDRSCQILAWYLIDTNELESAQNVLREYELATKEVHTPWIYHLKGIIEALLGNNEKALSLLQESLSLQENWLVRFNYAVVLYKTGQINIALDELRKIISFFEHKNIDLFKPELSKVRTKIGEIHLQKRNLDSAQLELKLALELDAKNITAWRLLKKLEELTLK
jgi:tetratricopeptide (TPR) repeat protein